MERKRNRYKEMERYMTYALLADAGVFVLYLLFAGFGIGWMKAFLAIVAIIGSGLCIAYLYLRGELLRLRSRWMAVGFAAILLVVLVSLLLNYPSPDPLKQLIPESTGIPATTAVIRDFLHF